MQRKFPSVLSLLLAVAFASSVYAQREIPRPLAQHPGNIFLSDEDVTVPLPAKASGTWKLVDFDGNIVRDGISASSRVELGKLPVGYYELSGAGATDPVTLAVLAPLLAPTPETSPIGIDVAMAWMYPTGAERHAVANLCTLAGMNWVRDRMSWPELEPKPGVFSPRNRYDETAEIQTAAGLHVLQVNHIGPPWGRNPKRFPEDLRDAYQFYKAIARRFKGKITALEPWNEADIDMFGGHTGSEMASMQKASYLGIKAGNPDLIACENVFAIARWQTLKDFENNDAGPYFDRFDLHHYVPLGQYPQTYALYRAASAGKPMWVTEFNVLVDWSGDPNKQEPDEKNLHIQALRVPKVFAKSLYEGVQAQFYFMLPHYVEGKRQYGLLHRDLTPRPAFCSLAAVGRLLADAKPAGRWKSDDQKLFAYVFRAKPDGQEKFVIVAWSSEGDKEVRWNVPTEKSYDDLGREAVGNWVGQVTLKNTPVFAVTSIDPSNSMKLDPPPKAPPLVTEKPSPVVLQVLFPDSARDVHQSLYHIAAEGPTTVPVYAYNFSHHSARGQVTIEGAANWTVALATSSIELQPNDRKEITVTITPPAHAAPTTQPIRMSGDFGADGKAVLSFNVSPNSQPAQETKK